MRPHRQKLLLVVGGDRLIARQLMVASEVGGWEIVAPPPTMLDLADTTATIDAVAGWRATAVIHVPAATTDGRRLVETSRNVAAAARRARTRLVQLSTDEVFAGRTVPYDETDAPDAVSPPGAWWARAEAAVHAADPQATVVRTSVVYGTDELSDLQRRIDRACRTGRDASFCTDEIRCPTHAADVAEAVIRLIGWRTRPATLNVAAPEAVSLFEFARTMAVWMGHDPVAIRPTSVALMAAAGQPRSGRVVLDVSAAQRRRLRCRLMSEWLDDPG